MRATHIRSDECRVETAGETLLEAYRRIRATTLSIAAPLSSEDQVVQSMPDASPTKWHLAHTTWFFETFILAPMLPGYVSFDVNYNYLFNSYYESVGARHPRPQRGLLTRPSNEEVTQYRAHVDEGMEDLLVRSNWWNAERLSGLLLLGINHEQQHQELMLTDILHAFSCNPLSPAYQPMHRQIEPGAVLDREWIAYSGGLYEVGHDGDEFAFDNEGPRHQVFVRPFRLAARPVTNGEWQAFIDDGGYRRPELWLSDGWAIVQSEAWRAPLYWRAERGNGWIMTLAGLQPLELAAPVCHVSYYEADAFARWRSKRLPTEFEWEIAARGAAPQGNMFGTGALRPCPDACPRGGAGPRQMFGDVWELTSSPYTPYPGYRPTSGAIGEYNGKFMCNQMVLRGGSCVTPDGHIRATYRNFFYPHQRWQFSGVRLADDE